MFEVWIEDINELMEELDKELIIVRKSSYDTASDMCSLNGKASNMDKEQGRHREKARLRDLKERIARTRRLLARHFFFSKIHNILLLFGALAMIVSVFSRSILTIVLAAILLFLMILSKVSEITAVKRLGELLVSSYANYGVIEATIKLMDFRDLESFDFEHLPVTGRYSLEELLQQGA